VDVGNRRASRGLRLVSILVLLVGSSLLLVLVPPVFASVTITTSTSGNATGFPSQHKVFNSTGLWWEWGSSDGTNLFCSSSSDGGTTWAAKTTITTSAAKTAGYYMGAYVSGSTLTYAGFPSGGTTKAFYLRQGTLSRSGCGSITFSFGEVTVTTTNNVVDGGGGAVTQDGSGNLYVALESNDGTNNHVEVWKCSATCGTSTNWSKVKDISPVRGGPAIDAQSTDVIVAYGNNSIAYSNGPFHCGAASCGFADSYVFSSNSGSTWSASRSTQPTGPGNPDIIEFAGVGAWGSIMLLSSKVSGGFEAYISDICGDPGGTPHPCTPLSGTQEATGCTAVLGANFTCYRQWSSVGTSLSFAASAKLVYLFQDESFGPCWITNSTDTSFVTDSQVCFQPGDNALVSKSISSSYHENNPGALWMDGSNVRFGATKIYPAAPTFSGKGSLILSNTNQLPNSQLKGTLQLSEANQLPNSQSKGSLSLAQTSNLPTDSGSGKLSLCAVVRVSGQTPGGTCAGRVAPSFVATDGATAISPAPSAFTLSGSQNGATATSTLSADVWDVGSSLGATSVTWDGIQVVNSSFSVTVPASPASTTQNVKTKVYAVATSGQGTILLAAASSLSISGISYVPNKLSFTVVCSNTCIVAPPSALGQPYYVTMDGTVYQQGSVWTWDSTNGIVKITGTSDYVVSWDPLSGTNVVSCNGCQSPSVSPLLGLNKTGTAVNKGLLSLLPQWNLLLAGANFLILLVLAFILVTLGKGAHDDGDEALAGVFIGGAVYMIADFFVLSTGLRSALNFPAGSPLQVSSFFLDFGAMLSSVSLNPSAFFPFLLILAGGLGGIIYLWPLFEEWF